MDPTQGSAGDLGPESIVFINAVGTPMPVIGNEITGSATRYRLSLE